jgi:hypothetical protein
MEIIIRKFGWSGLQWQRIGGLLERRLWINNNSRERGGMKA